MKHLKVLALAFGLLLSIIGCKKDQSTTSQTNVSQQIEYRNHCNVEPTRYNSAPPEFPGGNVNCSQIGSYEFSSGRIDDETRCGSTFGPITWSTDANCKYVSWSWTGAGAPCGVAVIVKGGNASNVYSYPAGCASGSNLASPLNNGGKVPGLSNITFCWNVCPDELECENETAFGGNTEGDGPAWWYSFDTQGPACQNIYAGQNLMVGGSVCYDPNTGMVNITLGPGWSLQNVPESVKVQGYAVLPTKRPPAGQFTTYKGTSLSVPGNGSRYYVIHLDVQYCE